jgi:hypothetical protein
MKDSRMGIRHELEGTDLIVFLPLQGIAPVEVSIQPE